MEELVKNYLRYKKIDIPALRAAVESSQPNQLLRLLLANRKDSYTAVMVAAEEGHTEACRLFLSPIRGTADELLWMKEENYGDTVLHIAVRREDSEFVELLLEIVSDERKYDFVAEKNKHGNTVIAWAAMCGSGNCIESVLYNLSSLQRDSLLKIQDNNLYTPLHGAAYNGDTTTLKVMLGSVSLVAVSSLLNTKDRRQRTPLDVAEYKGKKGSSELLSRWEKQPLVEALEEAKQRITTLHKKNEQKLSAVQKECDEKLFTLQKESNLKLSSLQGDSDLKLSVLQRESDQKLLALQQESYQKISTLQRQTELQAEALVEARQHVTILHDDSERTLSLLQHEARQQRADLAATQLRLEQVGAYIQTTGDTNLTGNQCHDPDS